VRWRSWTCAQVSKCGEAACPWWPWRWKNRAPTRGDLPAQGTAADNADKWHTARFVVAREGLQIGRSGPVHGLGVENGGDQPMVRSLGRQGAREWARQGGAGWEVVPVGDGLVWVRFVQAVLVRGREARRRQCAVAHERPMWPQKLSLDNSRGRWPIGERVRC
jgi:hypothetical protein